VSQFKAVLWDFGGVIFTSPFESFNLYERANGLPVDFIRGLNATNPDTNAWAQFERRELSVPDFVSAFEAEAQRAGHAVDAVAVLGALKGQVRPEMLAAVDAIKNAGLMNAGVTNNFAPMDALDWLAKFDVIIESSKVGVRKPDPNFYEIACETLGVSAADCVFLDDLGVNLKPAKAMGMTTIKVVDPDAALAELSAALELDLS
jgi:putative hydrolase of the HAD superfamily